jgi:hypothetical protein
MIDVKTHSEFWNYFIKSRLAKGDEDALADVIDFAIADYKRALLDKIQSQF